MTLRGKTILMTGATGLVGIPTVAALRSAGASVIILSRRAPTLSDGVTHIPYDLADPPTIEIPTYDAIVYAAASIPTGGLHKESQIQAFENTLVPFVRFLDRFGERAKQIVFTSTIDIYGRPSEAEFDESHKSDPQTPYALAKLMSEEYLQYFATEHGIDTTILRFSQVYGHNEPKVRVIPYLLDALLHKKPFQLWGNDQNERRFLFATDAADSIIRALEGPAGTYQIAGDDTISIRALIELMQEVSGKILTIEHKQADAPQANLLPSNASAKKKLRWNPMHTMRQGITEIITSYEH